MTLAMQHQSAGNLYVPQRSKFFRLRLIGSTRWMSDQALLQLNYRLPNYLLFILIQSVGPFCKSTIIVLYVLYGERWLVCALFIAQYSLTCVPVSILCLSIIMIDDCRNYDRSMKQEFSFACVTNFLKAMQAVDYSAESFIGQKSNGVDRNCLQPDGRCKLQCGMSRNNNLVLCGGEEDFYSRFV